MSLVESWEKGGEGAVREFCEYLISKKTNNEEPRSFEFNEINFKLKPYTND